MMDWGSINIGQVLFGLLRIFFMLVLSVVVFLVVKQDWDSLYKLKKNIVVFLTATIVNVCLSIQLLILILLLSFSFRGVLGLEFPELLMALTASWVICCAYVGWKQIINKKKHNMGAN